MENTTMEPNIDIKHQKNIHTQQDKDGHAKHGQVQTYNTEWQLDKANENLHAKYTKRNMTIIPNLDNINKF